MNLRDGSESTTWLLEEILACMQQSVLVMDSEGLIHYSSPNVRKILGFDPTELKGMNFPTCSLPKTCRFLPEPAFSCRQPE